jgi:hypothetical protein
VFVSENLQVLELSLKSNEFGRVLLVKPSMFGKLDVHVSEVVWRFEPITFHIRELRVKHILATHAKQRMLFLCSTLPKKQYLLMKQGNGVIATNSSRRWIVHNVSVELSVVTSFLQD